MKQSNKLKESTYFLLGEERSRKDFWYIFDELIHIIDVKSDIEAVLQEATNTPVILCGTEKDDLEESLKSRGFQKGKDYFYETDFFTLLDEFVIPSDRKIAVWGTGTMAKKLLSEIPDLCVSCFIDTNKNADEFYSRPVYFPKEIENWKQYYVIVAVMDDGAIRKELIKKALIDRVDFVGIIDFFNRPSVYLSKTYFDTNYYDLECHTMLNHLEILRDGETSCCCTTFMYERLGNITKMPKEQIWKSSLHKILCLSAVNHTYTFCKKDMCPLFIGKKRGKISDNLNEKEYQRMSDSPETLALAYDQTCNLYCTTCRDKMYIPTEEVKQKQKTLSDILIKNYLSDVQFLILAGDGEVFASPSYREVYSAAECEGICYIRLLSNGLLFNEHNWKELRKNKHAKFMLTVSIDAATKKTYENIRRGGDFEKLKKNMEFASALRKSGELSYFRINFVVQKRNYLEMPLFVEWGESLGCDEVFFTKILNWGTYTEEEFQNVSMMQSDGITPKPELLELSRDPRMQSDIVDMGTIQALHKQDTADAVKNYYMWELEKRGGKLFE